MACVCAPLRCASCAEHTQREKERWREDEHRAKWRKSRKKTEVGRGMRGLTHTHTHTHACTHTPSACNCGVNVIMYTVYPLCEREVQMKGESEREARVSPLQRGRWEHTTSSSVCSLVFQRSLLQIRPHAAFSVSTGKHTYTQTRTPALERK